MSKIKAIFPIIGNVVKTIALLSILGMNLFWPHHGAGQLPQAVLH
jgi:hypothetical protein